MALRRGTQQEEEEESEPGGAEATMKVQGGKDIRDQIQELRAIIRLQEQGRVLHTQSSKQRVNQNKDTVGLLRGSIRQRTREWQMARKHDERSISWAFREEHLLKLATNKTSMEVTSGEGCRGALESWRGAGGGQVGGLPLGQPLFLAAGQSVQQKLQKYIYDRVKVHDALVHLLRRRAAVLEDLQRELLRLRRLEEPSKETELQHQRIRQLENSIEKMEMKCSSAQSIHQMYENSLASLKQELASYPSKLSNMANMVGAYQSALQDMTQMAQETIEITEVTKVRTPPGASRWVRVHRLNLVPEPHARKRTQGRAHVPFPLSRLPGRGAIFPYVSAGSYARCLAPFRTPGASRWPGSVRPPLYASVAPPSPVPVAPQLDAAKAETALIAEHEAQESQLNAQKKQVDKAWVRDTGDRHRQVRPQAGRPGESPPPSPKSTGTVGPDPEEGGGNGNVVREPSPEGGPHNSPGGSSAFSSSSPGEILTSRFLARILPKERTRNLPNPRWNMKPRLFLKWKRSRPLYQCSKRLGKATGFTAQEPGRSGATEEN
uniref:Uncharacterized protein n=1 Tax=Ornithorhynchus anatinus TaxID=9258 RepID=A0A6I8NG28_ORNAN